MLRKTLILAAALGWASQVAAADLCLQVDSGPFAGSALVFDGTKPKGGPLNGYMAHYNGLNYSEFYPLHGQSIVATSDHRVAMGFDRSYVNLNASGPTATEITSGIDSVGIICTPGANKKLNVLDSCQGRLAGNGTPLVLHVIDCKSAPAP
jgi:hypothetical protein